MKGFTMKKISIFLVLALLVTVVLTVSAQDAAVTAEPGQEVNMLLLPKNLGNPVFDQAHAGAQEAHAELENPGVLEFNAPGPGEGPDAQIPFITSAVTQQLDAIMISNNGGEVVEPAAVEALEAGIPVVAWDSGISPAGQSVFISQVDFSTAGPVMLEMALKLLPEGGTMAILSATPDATNQNAWIANLQEAMEADPDTYGSIELVGIVYGNDVPEDSYDEAVGLIDQGVDLIMAPTTVGILAAAQAVRTEGVCGEVLVSGFGVSVEMQDFVQEGCAQDFALWSFEDLGYLTYYTAYLLATGAMAGDVGDTFVAGRMGEFTVEETADGGKQVLMGPFTVFSPETIDDWYFELGAEAEATEEASS